MGINKIVRDLAPAALVISAALASGIGCDSDTSEQENLEDRYSEVGKYKDGTLVIELSDGTKEIVRGDFATVLGWKEAQKFSNITPLGCGLVSAVTQEGETLYYHYDPVTARKEVGLLFPIVEGERAFTKLPIEDGRSKKVDVRPKCSGGTESTISVSETFRERSNYGYEPLTDYIDALKRAGKNGLVKVGDEGGNGIPTYVKYEFATSDDLTSVHVPHELISPQEALLNLESNSPYVKKALSIRPLIQALENGEVDRKESITAFASLIWQGGQLSNLIMIELEKVDFYDYAIYQAVLGVFLKDRANRIAFGILDNHYNNPNPVRRNLLR